MRHTIAPADLYSFEHHCITLYCSDQRKYIARGGLAIFPTVPGFDGCVTSYVSFYFHASVDLFMLNIVIDNVFSFISPLVLDSLRQFIGVIFSLWHCGFALCRLWSVGFAEPIWTDVVLLWFACCTMSGCPLICCTVVHQPHSLPGPRSELHRDTFVVPAERLSTWAAACKSTSSVRRHLSSACTPVLQLQRRLRSVYTSWTPTRRKT